MPQKPEFNWKPTVFLACLVVAYGVYTFSRPVPPNPAIHYSGDTMGTYYHVTIARSHMTTDGVGGDG